MISRAQGRRTRARIAAITAAGVLAAIAACKDSNVPFFTAPTSVPASPAGIQNAVTGLISAARIDIGTFVVTVGAGYSRDGAVFTNTEPRTVEYPLGVVPTPTTSGSVWNQEYTNIRQVQQILATLPKVTPAYTPAELAAITGVVQTLEAYDYMLVAEAHDTLGMAILPANASTAAATPAVCLKNAWSYIIALLDSANAQLATAGPTPIPLKFPPGFGGVTATAGPSTAVGSFASFNRALAAKAELELAYAIPRTPGGPGGAPTPTSAGSPNPAALNAALAALDSSAMFDTTQLATPTVPFTPSAFAVLHDYSAISGDINNPIFGSLGTIAQLKDFVADVDTAHDLRWKVKFGPNPNPVQQQTYNPVASKFIPIMYSNPGAPIPIIREVQLALYAAQIQLGLGNNAAALAIVNDVRAKVGGPALAPFPAGDAGSYVTTRNDLMKEQRISTTWEASDDRTISIRMYGMAAVSDTTWNGHEDPAITTPDAHTTVNPIPFGEISARGGSFTTTCSP